MNQMAEQKDPEEREPAIKEGPTTIQVKPTTREKVMELRVGLKAGSQEKVIIGLMALKMRVVYKCGLEKKPECKKPAEIELSLPEKVPSKPLEASLLKCEKCGGFVHLISVGWAGDLLEGKMK